DCKLTIEDLFGGLLFCEKWLSDRNACFHPLVGRFPYSEQPVSFYFIRVTDSSRSLRMTLTVCRHSERW
ncbi:hypothetical protein, partial [Dialister invisus]|uniref:hypothetical protein n=1 Tax=Dialister invisus TaxID=218538 RepID=UPI00307C55B2